MTKRSTLPTSSQDDILTERQLAENLGISISWLQHDRGGRRLLPFYRIGGHVRYNRQRVLQALAQMEEGGVSA